MEDQNGFGAFYEGVIDYQGAEPDFEGIAQAVNFLRSNNVMIDIGKARIKDGAACFPFIVKEPDALLPPFKEGGGKRSVLMLKQVFDGCAVSFRKASPNARKAPLLKACTRLSSMKPDSEFADAEDFFYREKQACGEGDDPFAGLVGMDAQKRTLREIADAVAKHGRSVLSSCHMAFVGSPGTGKTELARRLLAYCDRMGVTDGTGTFVKADAVNLIGRYVGETPRLVRDKVMQAEGGLLFIDEAYRLAETGRGGNAYAYEAVNTLVEMLRAAASASCAARRLPGEMERLLGMNVGLRDRIGSACPSRLRPRRAVRHLRAFARANRFALAADAGARSAPRAGRCPSSGLRQRAQMAAVERTVIKLSQDAGTALITAGDVRAALTDADVSGADAVRTNPIGFAG
ncbi:MAG: AAA family ATPase [Eggerthellaceae bacterium]